jgi:uncharacterized protein
MSMPTDVGIVDTMISFPLKDPKATYAFVTRQLKDETAKEFEFPVEYMFKDVPHPDTEDDPVAVTLREMDRYGIAVGLVGVGRGGAGQRAVQEHPDRFVASISVDPNEGMKVLRAIDEAKSQHDLRSVEVFPAGTFPQVAINDKRMYPIYAKCCELDLPIFVCAGVPGPRLRMEPQKVEYIDEVMYDFPELVFVTRHGCEPWTELAVKLMLKWPGLHYSTSAFAPKYYPKDIINYANTRGADKVIYAGYYPMGLSLERIMREMPGVPFNDDVWPKFLRENAARVLKLF